MEKSFNTFIFDNANYNRFTALMFRHSCCISVTHPEELELYAEAVNLGNLGLRMSLVALRRGFADLVLKNRLVVKNFVVSKYFMLCNYDKHRCKQEHKNAKAELSQKVLFVTVALHNVVGTIPVLTELLVSGS